VNTPEQPQHRDKVSLPDILAKVKSATYTVLPDGKTTICQLHMENGYTINGQSACVDPANYNKALGEKYAYEDAIDNAWPLEGYLLAEELYQRGPKPTVYSWRDVASHQHQTSSISGELQFVVQMKDGKKFQGTVDALMSRDQPEVLIIKTINKQIAEGASA
jgi:hypothetical protein